MHTILNDPSQPMARTTKPPGRPRQRYTTQKNPPTSKEHHGPGASQSGAHIYHRTTKSTPLPSDTRCSGSWSRGGGVWLPCTEHIRPTIWHLKRPADIETAVKERKLSMADCESGAYFVQECILDHLLQGRVAGISTHHFSDNMPTVGQITKHKSRGKSPFAKYMLHCLGIRQVLTRRGLADCTHWPGKENLMGDIPSRSFEEGFPEGSYKKFQAYFAHRFPLPPSFPHMFNGQPDSWQLVTPPSGIVSTVILLL
jgi:hypothetical protein